MCENGEVVKLLQSIDGRIAWLCRLMEDVYEGKDANRHDSEKQKQEVNNYVHKLVGIFENHPGIANDPKAKELLRAIPNFGGSE